MQTIVLILVLAITVEALIQYSKTIIEMLEKNGVLEGLSETNQISLF